jgi:uncharacterized protein YcfJ
MQTISHPAAVLFIAAASLTAAASASAQVTFYENDNYQGRSFNTNRSVDNFPTMGFNDRASSIVVTRGRWEVCDDVAYGGRCMVLRAGSYPSLRAMGMNDRISSVRTLRASDAVADDRYGPPAPAPSLATSAWRRRNGERVFEAPVSEVRAVVGPAEQRCWVERQEVVTEDKRSRVPGAILGAVLGGVIGHQIGGGRGQDIATAGGAVAGAAVGSRVGSGGQRSESRDVQRCQTVPSQAGAEYWDVTYSFRGQQHHAQLTQPPGATITVNNRGEPRE